MMDKIEKFSNGDKVVRIGTKTPVMIIKGKTMKGGLPYTPLLDIWTCYWQDHEPHWEEINESELILFSDNENANAN